MSRGLKERVAELEKQRKIAEWAWQDRLAAMETDLARTRLELEEKRASHSSSQTNLMER